MHIPSVERTKDMEIETFDSALKEALVPNGEYDINKWLYVPCVYTEYRYILGTRGKNPLICIGINPSTARPDDLDNTLKSVERVALFNGFDSFIMFNVYAQRATSPDDMEREKNEQLHAENMKAFEYVLGLCEAGKRPHIWAAWGTIIEKREYLCECVRDMIDIGEKHNAEWCMAGRPSKAGHPHHPLYLPKNSALEPFDPALYLEKTAISIADKKLKRHGKGSEN